MSAISEFANIWSAVKEIDLRPIRVEAERILQIAIVGRKGAGKHRLADRMRHDLWREEVQAYAPLRIVDLGDEGMILEPLSGYDLIVLVAPADARHIEQERGLQKKWLDAGQKVLGVINAHPLANRQTEKSISTDSEPPEPAIQTQMEIWDGQGWLVGDIADPIFLRDRFIPAVLAMLPDKLLALGRNYPLFRVAIGRQLINETCFTNAAYAFSTGLAEIVPVLDIPLNVADMFILSKNQAFLVYRLGLALGFSTHWQDYLKEFSGVLGSGFFWRQIARQLVGLIPAWGILPKVAVSYAGTYVIGQAVLQWYLTGRHISRQQIRQLYGQAFARGKQLASRFVRHRSRLNAGQKANPKKPGFCSVCGKKNSRRAQFCQFCGASLRQETEQNSSPLDSSVEDLLSARVPTKVPPGSDEEDGE